MGPSIPEGFRSSVTNLYKAFHIGLSYRRL